MHEAHHGIANTLDQSAHQQSPERVRRWVVPGAIAGALFLALEMLIGAFASTAWAFPEGIAHTIGIGTSGYSLQPLALSMGVIVHLTVSAGLGALFTTLTDRLRLTGARVIVAAWLYSGTETAVAIWVVLHPLLPTRLPLLLDAVPLWASIVGHNVYGLTLGVLANRSQATAPSAGLSTREV